MDNSKCLIAVATEIELPASFRKGKNFYLKKQITESFTADILITGVGAVPTAYELTRVVDKYSFVLNLGVAGSFSSELEPGNVVLVRHDAFADYGIDDQGQFTHIDNFPFSENYTVQLSNMNNNFIDLLSLNLPVVKGITVATASGSAERIAFLKRTFNPDIETMESAAVFYVCLRLGIPFLAMRAISNFVEPRNRSNWNLPLAVDRLWSEFPKIIDSLASKNFL